MENQNSGADFFAGLLLGLIVGAALAILAAPRWREEIQAQLQERSADWTSSAAESLRNARDRAEDIVDDARSRSA